MTRQYVDGSGIYLGAFSNAPLDGVQVPTIPPSAYYTWNGSSWDAPAPTVDQVKAEAQRRILAFCPEFKQRNLTARSVRLNRKALVVPPVITPAEQDDMDLADAVFDHIDAIRQASDTLEGTLPVDYQDDSHWPVDPGLDLSDK